MPRPLAVERSINGEHLRLTPEFALAEPVHDEWEEAVYGRFKQLLRPGMVVFDVGASFGLYAIGAARAVGSSGRVFAFEPARRTAAALRSHLRWNGVADRVEVIRAAVAAESGRRDFWEHETSFLASLLEASPRAEEARFSSPVKPRPVPTVTLDDFCAWREVEPDVVKVDVEGGEAAVLLGARRLLRRRRSVLFLEVHHTLLERTGASPGEPFEELDAAGWTCEDLHAEPAGTRHYLCRPARGSDSGARRRPPRLPA